MWRTGQLLSKSTAKIPQQEDQELMQRIQLGVVIPSNTAPFSTLSLPCFVLNKSSQLSISKSSLATPCLHGTACFSQPSRCNGLKSPPSNMKRNRRCSCGLPFSARSVHQKTKYLECFSTLQMKSGWLGQGQFLSPDPGQAAFRPRTWTWLLSCSDRALGKALLHLQGNVISPMDIGPWITAL